MPFRIRPVTPIVALLFGCAFGCQQGSPSPEGGPVRAAAIAHAGVGTPAHRSDGPRAAVDVALAALARGASPLEAAVAGVVVLENDPRFNAGTGSRVRLDGVTVQMDASVMTSAGDFGAVAIIERVRNPVLVAREVLDSPHSVIAGEGATQFARAMGLPDYDPATEHRRAQTRRIVERLRNRDPRLERSWRGYDWRSRWNFETPLSQLGLPTQDDQALAPDVSADTVGVAVRGEDGTFAVALSTGGTSTTLRGRVGDVPLIGAGLFASPNGAVASTGKGERIADAATARTLVTRLDLGHSIDDAAADAIATVAPRGSIGVIVISRNAMTAKADRSMAWAAKEQGGPWVGPAPGPDPVAK